MSKKNTNIENQQTAAPGTPAQDMKEILRAEMAEAKAKKKAAKQKKKGVLAVDVNGKPVPDLNKKHVRGIESKRSMYGRLFILPWEIGMILFFIIPLVQSLWYSFCYVDLDGGIGGFSTEFVGLTNYQYIFNEDPNYVNYLMASLSKFFTSMPIIVIVSLILALVLNGNFKGRIVFRGIFFIPVIVATGVVMTLLTRNYEGYGQIIQLSANIEEDAYSVVGTGGGMNFSTILNNLNLPENITAQMSMMITNIFNTIWTCGIPIVLFIAGLQTIPAQLYEASKVEGATGWEEFWYITLPMISQTLLLVIVFTLIELFTQSNNQTINLAYQAMTKQVNYYDSAAMLWVFFAIIGAVVGLVILIYSKTCLKKWE